MPVAGAIDYVDVDSQGRVYVGDGATGKIWKSEDRGKSWVQTSYFGSLGMLYVDNRDYIYANHGGKIKRSVDQGANWVELEDVGEYLWHWDEDADGRVYANNYDNAAPTIAYVYRSDTDGTKISVWLNLTGQTWHMHDVAVAPNGWVFVTTGDTHRGATYGSIRRWNGTDWETIVQSDIMTNTQRYTQPTTVWFMGNYTYFGADEWDWIIRMPTTGSWSERENVVHIPSVDG